MSNRKVDIGDGFYTRGKKLFDEVSGTAWDLPTRGIIMINPDSSPRPYAEVVAAALRAGYDWDEMVAEWDRKYVEEHGCTIWESITKLGDEMTAFVAECDAREANA